MAINTDVAKGQWTELKGKIKSKWAKLTDNDLDSVEGNFDELKGKLQQVYGYSKERAEEEFNTTFSKYADRANDKIDVAKDRADRANDRLSGDRSDRLTNDRSRLDS
jgi:uncharacterized protein YjbJ (UPF0337 family)